MPTEPNGSCFFFGDFPLCGCGDPESALGLILNVLTAAEENKDLLKAIGGDTPANWLALYAIDHAKLIEHGGSIHYSWLTGKGLAALAYLREHGVEYDEWPIDKPITWQEP